jgi:hypothetical protein
MGRGVGDGAAAAGLAAAARFTGLRFAAFFRAAGLRFATLRFAAFFCAAGLRFFNVFFLPPRFFAFAIDPPVGSGRAL